MEHGDLYLNNRYITKNRIATPAKATGSQWAVISKLLFGYRESVMKNIVVLNSVCCVASTESLKRKESSFQKIF